MPCDKCLEQRWEYEKLPNCWLRTTCQECNNVIEWQSKKRLEKEVRRSFLLKNQIGTGSGQEFTWTMVDGKHYRNGVEMALVRKGRDEKCTIGYAEVRPEIMNWANNVKNITFIDPLTYVHPQQKSFLKDV